MKLKALSYYDNDRDTRFGDCILLYNNTSLIVYDCGHSYHANEVEDFLKEHSIITEVHIVISHNDSDHVNGIVELLEYLHDEEYLVTVHTSLYLKSAQRLQNLLNDERRTLPKTKEHILKTFDRIRDIVEKAEELGQDVKNATVDSNVLKATIVGPTEDEFVEVVAEAIKSGGNSMIEGETVMNAASIQLKCTLENSQIILLCGDASPSSMHNLDSYDIIQLPHHGQLEDAQRIFDKLTDSYSKEYFISDNTGSGETSGGSDKLVEYMKDECYTAALNTKNGIVNIPAIGYGNTYVGKPKGVKLGVMDCEY